MDRKELHTELDALDRDLREILNDATSWYFAFTGYSHVLIGSLRDHVTSPDHDEIYWRERSVMAAGELRGALDRYWAFTTRCVRLLQAVAVGMPESEQAAMAELIGQNRQFTRKFEDALRRGSAAAHDIIGQDPKGHAFIGMCEEIVTTEKTALELLSNMTRVLQQLSVFAMCVISIWMDSQRQSNP